MKTDKKGKTVILLPKQYVRMVEINAQIKAARAEFIQTQRDSLALR